MPILIPRSKTVTLDASGGGTVTFEIDNSNARWIIDETHVETNQAATATPIPQARTYRNGVPQGGTFSGNFDQGSGRVVLYPDDVFTVTWSGGIAGSVATAVIGGTFDPQGTKIADG